MPTAERVFSLPSPRMAHSLAGLSGFALLYAWTAGHVRIMAHKPWVLLSTLGQNTHQVPYHSLCVFKDALHLPCPFCGLTRSFVLIEQGNWQTSTHYYLLGLPVFILAVLLAVGGPFFPRQTEAALRWMTARPVIWGVLGVILACWLWKLTRDPAYW